MLCALRSSDQRGSCVQGSSHYGVGSGSLYVDGRDAKAWQQSDLAILTTAKNYERARSQEAPGETTESTFRVEVFGERP